MLSLRRSGILLASAAALALMPVAGSGSASATPNIAAPAKTITVPDAGVEKVRSKRHWRGRRGRHHGRRHHGRRHYGGHHRRWRHRHRRHNDWGDAIPYLALGLMGSLIHEGAYGNNYYGATSAKRRCARRFRSFEWDSGLYTTYGGRKRLCPYLR
jgi:hypothetical protein